MTLTHDHDDHMVDYTSSKNQGSSSVVTSSMILDTFVVSPAQVKLILQGQIQDFETDQFLIQIDGPWKQDPIIRDNKIRRDGTKNSHGSQDSGSYENDNHTEHFTSANTTNPTTTSSSSRHDGPESRRVFNPKIHPTRSTSAVGGVHGRMQKLFEKKFQMPSRYIPTREDLGGKDRDGSAALWNGRKRPLQPGEYLRQFQNPSSKTTKSIEGPWTASRSIANGMSNDDDDDDGRNIHVQHDGNHATQSLGRMVGCSDSSATANMGKSVEYPKSNNGNGHVNDRGTHPFVTNDYNPNSFYDSENDHDEDNDEDDALEDDYNRDAVGNNNFMETMRYPQQDNLPNDNHQHIFNKATTTTYPFEHKVRALYNDQSDDYNNVETSNHADGDKMSHAELLKVFNFGESSHFAQDMNHNRAEMGEEEEENSDDEGSNDDDDDEGEEEVNHGEQEDSCGDNNDNDDEGKDCRGERENDRVSFFEGLKRSHQRIDKNPYSHNYGDLIGTNGVFYHQDNDNNEEEEDDDDNDALPWNVFSENVYDGNSEEIHTKNQLDEIEKDHNKEDEDIESEYGNEHAPNLFDIHVVDENSDSSSEEEE